MLNTPEGVGDPPVGYYARPRPDSGDLRRSSEAGQSDLGRWQDVMPGRSRGQL
jgi:hypothetical protein